MSGIRLSDILKNKKAGEEWFTMMAPEELHKWLLKKPWPSDCFNRRGVHLLSASVSSSEPVKQKGLKDARLTKKEPWTMSNGVDIESGYFKTATSKAASFRVRADSSVEFSEIMTELSARTGLKIWDINVLEVANNKLGAIIEFKMVNPDSNGTSLYFYRLTVDGNSRLYPDVLRSRQEEVVPDFFDKFAHCTCVEEPEKTHGCAVKHRVPSTQIKRKKKSIPNIAA